MVSFTKNQYVPGLLTRNLNLKEYQVKQFAGYDFISCQTLLVKSWDQWSCVSGKKKKTNKKKNVLQVDALLILKIKECFP